MIQTFQPKEGLNVIAVKVPDDAHSFEVVENNVVGGKCLMYLRGNPDYACSYSGNLPDGFVTILADTASVTEEQWKDIVEQVRDWRTPLYYSYEAKGSDFRDIVESSYKTATESGQSFLRANNLEGRHIILEQIKK